MCVIVLRRKKVIVPHSELGYDDYIVTDNFMLQPRQHTQPEATGRRNRGAGHPTSSTGPLLHQLPGGAPDERKAVFHQKHSGFYVSRWSMLPQYDQGT